MHQSLKVITKVASLYCKFSVMFYTKRKVHRNDYDMIDKKGIRGIYVLKEILWTVILALAIVLIPFGIVI